MLDFDLKDARIKKVEHDRVIDIHALRHTFTSKVMDPKTFQKVIEHSGIRITMRYYTHRLTSDLAAAKMIPPEV